MSSVENRAVTSDASTSAQSWTDELSTINHTVRQAQQLLLQQCQHRFANDAERRTNCNRLSQKISTGMISNFSADKDSKGPILLRGM
jgi:hypothetical protein